MGLPKPAYVFYDCFLIRETDTYMYVCILTYIIYLQGYICMYVSACIYSVLVGVPNRFYADLLIRAPAQGCAGGCVCVCVRMS